MSSAHNLENIRFGRLVAIETVGSDKSGIKWACRCDCGSLSVVSASILVKGKTVSCGCYADEQRAKSRLKHGHASHSNKKSIILRQRNNGLRILERFY